MAHSFFMKREDLIAYLDAYLNIPTIADYGPQGLQVEADNVKVMRIALAVDTSPVTIQAAADWQANMLLVHHGIFWGGAERIAGPFGRRVKMLIQNDIHLYAAHLALDAHPEVGNNAVLAQMFGVTVDSWWGEAKGTPIGVLGHLAEPMAVVELETAVALTSARPYTFPLPHLGDGQNKVGQVAKAFTKQGEAKRKGVAWLNVPLSGDGWHQSIGTHYRARV